MSDEYVKVKIALRYHLSDYDAIHVATSLEANINNFISNDDDFRRIRELTVVKPLNYKEWKKNQ